MNINQAKFYKIDERVDGKNGIFHVSILRHSMKAMERLATNPEGSENHFWIHLIYDGQAKYAIMGSC